MPESACVHRNIRAYETGLVISRWSFFDVLSVTVLMSSSLKVTEKVTMVPDISPSVIPTTLAVLFHLSFENGHEVWVG